MLLNDISGFAIMGAGSSTKKKPFSNLDQARPEKVRHVYTTPGRTNTFFVAYDRR